MLVMAPVASPRQDTPAYGRYFTARDGMYLEVPDVTDAAGR